jgi:UPF0271 protein
MFTDSKNSDESSANLALVLDATAFVSDIPFQSSSQEFYTTTEIIAEIKQNENIRMLIETRKLHVLEPSKSSSSKAKTAAIQTGDYETLSKADLSIVALAITLKEEYGRKCEVVSDDFAIENICSTLSITFRNVMTKGIGKEIRWVLICPGCGKEITSDARSSSASVCPICGSKLKRKPMNTKRILR